MKRELKIYLLLGLAGGLSLSACGVQPYNSDQKAATPKPFYAPATEDVTVPDENGGNITTGSSGTTGTQPPVSLRVDAIGYTSTSVEVLTRTILKVKFTPGVQDRTPAGTGYMIQYSGLGVYISVGSSSKPTPLLYNGVNGGTAESSSALDFSGAFSKSCPSSDSTCRQTVSISVGKPNYDYWCLQSVFYCPWTHVSDTHPWNGTLTIQTDDTTAI